MEAGLERQSGRELDGGTGPVPRGRGHSEGRGSHFRGNWMNSAMATPVSRSKIRSLYISCPSRVSQHWGRQKGVRMISGLLHPEAQAPESPNHKHMRYFLGSLLPLAPPSSQTRSLTEDPVVPAPCPPHREFFVIVATGLARRSLCISPASDLTPKRQEQDQQRGQAEKHGPSKRKKGYQPGLSARLLLRRTCSQISPIHR